MSRMTLAKAIAAVELERMAIETGIALHVLEENYRILEEDYGIQPMFPIKAEQNR